MTKLRMAQAVLEGVKAAEAWERSIAAAAAAGVAVRNKKGSSEEALASVLAVASDSGGYGDHAALLQRARDALRAVERLFSRA